MARKKKRKALPVEDLKSKPEPEASKTQVKTVKLKNLKQRMRVFNLDGEYFRAQEGENGLGKPEVLTLLPLELKHVDIRVLDCREVALALRPEQPRVRPTLRVLG